MRRTLHIAIAHTRAGENTGTRAMLYYGLCQVMSMVEISMVEAGETNMAANNYYGFPHAAAQYG